jgi:3'(2'), 5'-bisphosphate nucleotidase
VNHNDYEREHRDAREIANAAGDALLELRRELATGGDPKDLRDRGDRSSHDLIVALLAERYPDDAILSEEAKDNPIRLERRRVWIVDPLDGTREFGEDGRSDWAVHVALAVDHVPVVGAVALPGRSLTLGTEPAPTLAPASSDPPRIVVSRTRPPAVALQVAEALDGLLVEMGSAGAKAMAVVLGEVDIYVHAGGQYEWDSAAPVAVALAAGLHVSRIDGTPIRYNQPNPWLPDLLICRPEYATNVLDVLAAAASGGDA